MHRALSTAASGMAAQERRLSTIANNLANVNTTAFKKARVEFQDLLYETERAAGAPDDDGRTVPTDLQVGHGVRPVSTPRSFKMGDIRETSSPYDMAIQDEGGGFFQIEQTEGVIAYTRDGGFMRDNEGRLVTANGAALQPPIIVPQGTNDFTVHPDGRVTGVPFGQTDSVELGRISLATFMNPAGLRGIGDNLFRATEASGEPQLVAPGSNGVGNIRQRALESSNVSVVDEMIELIATQRAYETNSKVIKAADEMMNATAQIR